MSGACYVAAKFGRSRLLRIFGRINLVLAAIFLSVTPAVGVLTLAGFTDNDGLRRISSGTLAIALVAAAGMLSRSTTSVLSTARSLAVSMQYASATPSDRTIYQYEAEWRKLGRLHTLRWGALLGGAASIPSWLFAAPIGATGRCGELSTMGATKDDLAGLIGRIPWWVTVPVLFIVGFTSPWARSTLRGYLTIALLASWIAVAIATGVHWGWLIVPAITILSTAMYSKVKRVYRSQEAWWSEVNRQFGFKVVLAHRVLKERIDLTQIGSTVKRPVRIELGGRVATAGVIGERPSSGHSADSSEFLLYEGEVAGHYRGGDWDVYTTLVRELAQALQILGRPDKFPPWYDFIAIRPSPMTPTMALGCDVAGRVTRVHLHREALDPLATDEEVCEIAREVAGDLHDLLLNIDSRLFLFAKQDWLRVDGIPEQIATAAYHDYHARMHLS
jgi:hypothetical protein